jgi:epoxyqueuosine reductase
VVSSIINKARSLGFVSVGISRPEKPLFFDRFREWIAAGNQADMHWMEKHLDLREDPEKLLDGCKTIISLAYPYSSTKPLTSDGFSVARYTEPGKIDYHDRLKKLAKGLAESILEQHPGCKTRICVDSAPILERSFAYASGIGFIGKNNALIIPGHGSYVFLAEILTTAQMPQPDIRPMENQCGSCDLCLNACPAGALEAPYSLNASKCLSYLTIEHKGEIRSPGVEKMGNCFFGCDVCQEVCPFNEDVSSNEISLPSTDEVLGMDEKAFKTLFGKTAFSRAGLNKLKSNIRAATSKNC